MIQRWSIKTGFAFLVPLTQSDPPTTCNQTSMFNSKYKYYGARLKKHKIKMRFMDEDGNPTLKPVNSSIKISIPPSVFFVAT